MKLLEKDKSLLKNNTTPHLIFQEYFNQNPFKNNNHLEPFCTRGHLIDPESKVDYQIKQVHSIDKHLFNIHVEFSFNEIPFGSSFCGLPSKNFRKGELNLQFNLQTDELKVL